jgi:hypothetical protein
LRRLGRDRAQTLPRIFRDVGSGGRDHERGVLKGKAAGERRRQFSEAESVGIRTLEMCAALELPADPECGAANPELAKLLSDVSKAQGARK